MFEQLIAYLFKTFLGEYVEDGHLFQDKIQLGVWSGLLLLENLVLKKSVVDLIDAPISLRYGFIGRLEVRIPWSNLGVDPVAIIIDKVHFLLEPTYEWKPGAAEKRLQAIKQAKLSAAELFASKRVEEDSTNTSSWNYGQYLKQWFLSSFLTRVIEHIQITVREVHIRYEDHLSCPTSFAIGLCLESLHVQSRNNDISLEKTLASNEKGDAYDEKKMEFASDKTHPNLHAANSTTCFKLVQINHLSVYWNPISRTLPEICTLPYIGRPFKDVQSLMSRTVANRTHQSIDRPHHHYLLHPVDINSIIDISFNPSTGVTKARVKLFLPDISIQIEDRQFREIISLSVNMSNFAKLEKFSEYRPQEDVRSNPRSWWRYAIQAVIVQIKIDRKKTFDWRRLVRRLHDKLVYIDLWKSKLVSNQVLLQRLEAACISLNTDYRFFERNQSALYQQILAEAKALQRFAEANKGSTDVDFQSKNPRIVKPLEQDTMELLRAIEYELTFEDIILFRSLAEKQLSREVTQQSWLSGVFSWLSGSKTSQVAEEEKAKLFAALQYDPERLMRGGARKIDPNEVVAIFCVHLSRGSVTVALSPPEDSTSQVALPFLRLNMDDLRVEAFVMGDGSHIQLNLTLQAFSASDLSTALLTVPSAASTNEQKFIFRRLVSSSSSRQDKDDISSLGSIPRPSHSYVSSINNISKDNLSEYSSWSLNPLISLKIEKNPPNRRDTEVIVEIEFDELQVLLNPFAKWTESLGTFFMWPETVRYWSEMEMSAMNQLADFKSRIDAKLEYMMNNHSNVQIAANIKAPVILIVDEKNIFNTPNLDILVVDLGLVTLHTEKLAKAARQRNLETQSRLSDVSTRSTPTRSSQRMSFSNYSSKFLPEQGTRSVSVPQNDERKDQQPHRFNDSNLASQLFDGAQRSMKVGGASESAGPNRSKRRHADDDDEDLGDDNLPPKIRHRSSDGSRANTFSTSNTNIDEDVPEDELFDIFQLQVSQIEVCLIKSDLLGVMDRAEFDLQKAVIVDKFEIVTEIQSSVLPWDTSLPPVKLMIDIPELHIQLSESKVKRLIHFTSKIIEKSNEITNKLKSRQIQDILRTRQVVDTSRRRSMSTISVSKRRSSMESSKLKNDNASVAASTSTYQKLKRAKSFDVASQNSSYQKYNASSIHDSDWSDDDNESFFSLDDNNGDEIMDDDETAIQADIEKLRSVIQQQEASRARLMSEIRVCEADVNKALYQMRLKEDLKECEQKLREANAQYVEILISSSSVLNTPNGKVDLTNENNLEMAGLKDIMDSFNMYSSGDALKDELLHKRDVIHASLFKTRLQPTVINTEAVKRLNKLRGNTELAFIRLNLNSLSIDVQCSQTLQSFAEDSGKIPPPLSPRTHRKGRQQHKRSPTDNSNNFNTLSGSVFRLKLAGINVRLRHRTWDSKVNFVLRELELEDLHHKLYSGFSQTRYLADDQGFLLSSETAAFESYTGISQLRKYMPNGSTDFIKLKYEIHQIHDNEVDTVDKEDASSQTLKVAMGFLGVNVAPLQWLQLVEFFDSLKTSDEKSPVSQPSSTQKGDTKMEQPENKKNDERSSMTVIVKVDSITCCLLDISNNPILIGSIWSQQIFFHSTARQISVNYRTSDIKIFDVSKVSMSSVARNNSESAEFFYCIPENAMFYRHQSDEATSFLQFSLKLTMSDNEVPLITVSAKLAALVLKVDPYGIYNIVNALKDGFWRTYKKPALRGSSTEPTSTTVQNTAVSGDSTTVADPIDEWVMFIVDVSSANIDVQIGSITIIVPTDYSEGVKVKVNEIGTRIAWGDHYGFFGVDASIALREISVLVSAYSLIDPFDIYLFSTISPTAVVVEPSRQSMRPKRLSKHFKTRFPPIHFPVLQKGELQVSASFSPIKISVHEAIIVEILKWSSYTSTAASSIINILSTSTTQPVHEDMKPFLEDDVTDRHRDGSINSVKSLQWKVALVLHEVSIGFYRIDQQEQQSATQPIGSSSFIGFRRHLRTKNARTFSGGKPPVDSSAFHIPKGNPSLHLILQSCIIKAQSSARYEDSYIEGNSENNDFLLFSLSLRSVDLECPKGGCYKRMLFSQSYNESEPSVDSWNVLELSAALSQSMDLDIDIDICKLHVAVLHPVIEAMTSLTASYVQAVKKALHNQLDVITDGIVFNELANKKDKALPHSSRPVAAQAKAYPSSIPMSLESKDQPQSSSTPFESESTAVKKVFLLHKQSFHLDPRLKSINIVFVTRSCGLWIPTDPLQSQSAILAATGDISLSISSHEVDWTFLEERNNEEDSKDVCFVKNSINIADIGVFFASSIPKDVLCKVQSFSAVQDFEHSYYFDALNSVDAHAHRMYRRRIPSLAGSSVFIQRALLYPFDINVDHQLVLAINRDRNGDYSTLTTVESNDIDCQQLTNASLDIKNIVTAKVAPIEVQVFLDFHQLQRVISDVIDPIVATIGELVSQLNSPTFDTRDINPAYSTPSTRPYEGNRFSEAPLSQLPSQNEAVAVVLDSLLALLTNGMEGSTLSLSVEIGNLSVNIINDLLSLSVPVAKLSCHDISAQVDLPSSMSERGRVYNLVPHQLQIDSYQAATDLTELAALVSTTKSPQNHQLSCRFSANIRLDYYNQNLIATEPFIEPFRLNLVFEHVLPRSSNSSAFVLSRGIKKSIYSTSEVNQAVETGIVRKVLSNIDVVAELSQAGTSHLHVEIAKGIDINITIALLELLFSVERSLTKLKSSGIHVQKENSSEVSTILIQNDSGLIAKYTTRDHTVPVEIPMNCEVPVIMSHVGAAPVSQSSGEKNMSFLDHQLNRISKMINLSLHRLHGESWLPLRDVTFEGLGSKLYSLETDSTQKTIPVLDRFRTTKFATYVVLDLVSKSGIKTLHIRSTMKIVNTTSLPFTVKLLAPLSLSSAATSSPHGDSKQLHILWESVVPANVHVPVPANFCSIPEAKFLIIPEVKYLRNAVGNSLSNNQRLSKYSLLHAEIPIPVIQELKADKSFKRQHSDTLEDLRGMDIVDEDVSHNNDIPRRRKFVQEKGLVDKLVYHHWLNFSSSSVVDAAVRPSSAVCCNVSVVTKGPLRESSAETAWLSTLTLVAPIKIVNYLAGEIEVTLLPLSAFEDQSLSNITEVKKSLDSADLAPSGSLLPGQFWDCMHYHSIDDVVFSIKIRSDKVADSRSWSAGVLINGCKSKPNATTTLSVPVQYKNESQLRVLIDVDDSGGLRTLSLYVPYWVVCSSALPLQLQHCYGTSSSTQSLDPSLNGSDGICADQIFEMTNKHKSQSTAEKKSLKGSRKARGIDGIILGPDVPSRGLSDILKRTSSARFVTASSSWNSSSSIQNTSAMSLPSTPTNDSNNFKSPTFTQFSTSTPHGTPANYDQKPEDIPTYRLVQCSYSNAEKKAASVRLRSKGTDWSRSISLDLIGNSDVIIQARKGTGGAKYDEEFSSSSGAKDANLMFPMGVITSTLEAPFDKTKLVIVIDKTILINSIGQSIEVRQWNYESSIPLREDAQSPMWWRRGPKLVQIRLNRFGWSWSGKFSVEEEAEIPIRLRNDFDNTVYFVLVRVIKQEARIFAVFNGGDKFSPYRFENHTLETFKVRQKGQAQATNLLPYHCCAYAWDEPLAPHSFIIEIASEGSQLSNPWIVIGSFDFDKLQSIEQNQNSHLIFRVIAQGPIRVLQIFDKRSDLLVHQPTTNINTLSGKNNIFGFTKAVTKKDDALSTVKLKVSASIAHLGVSVIDKAPQELLYLSVKNFQLEYTLHSGGYAIDMSLERLQVDNQLWSTPFPCLLYPWKQKPDDESPTMIADGDFLSLQLTRDFEYPGIHFFPAINLRISPFEVNVEGTIVLRVLRMVHNVNESLSAAQNTTDSISSSSSSSISTKSFGVHEDFSSKISYTPKYDNTTPLSVRLSGFSYGSPDAVFRSHKLVKNALKAALTTHNLTAVKSKIYVQNLHVSEIKINVSVNPVISNDIAASDQSILNSAVSAVLLAIGSSLAKIENCPIRFKEFEISNLFASSQKYVDSFISHYTIQAISQAHIIVGSSELLGNPTRMIRNLGHGLWDFLYMPTLGLYISPEAFLMGVFRGTSSLLRRSIGAVFSTAGHFAASLQVGMIALGVVDHYPNLETIRVADTNAVTVATPGNDVISSRNFSNSNANSLRPKSFISGMKSGLYGLIYDPIHGYRRDGVKGFLMGCVKGYLGVFGRPFYGLLSVYMQELGRMYLSLGFIPKFLGHEKQRLLRSRPPRFFPGVSQPLKVYHANENIGLELLSRIDSGEYQFESYLWHTRLSMDRVLIMTKSRILLVIDSITETSISWQCTLAHVLSLEVQCDELSSRNAVNNALQLVSGALGAPEEDDDNDSVNSSSYKRILFREKDFIVGSVALSIYHRPKASDSTMGPSSGRKEWASKSSGLALESKTVVFDDYRAVVQLLLCLCKLTPVLLSTDIVSFLRFTGVTVYESADIEKESSGARTRGTGGVNKYSLNKRSLFRQIAAAPSPAPAMMLEESVAVDSEAAVVGPRDEIFHTPSAMHNYK